MKFNPYKILGVEIGACHDEIKAAYKALAQKHHPDRSKDDGANEKFQDIQKAYEVLKDPERRAEYDATGNIDKSNDKTSALNILGGYFQKAMMSWDGYSNPVAEINRMCAKELLVARANKAELFESLKNLGKLEKRFKFNGEGINIFQNIIDHARSSINSQSIEIDKHIVRVELAMDLLGDYKSVDDLANNLQIGGGGFGVSINTCV